VRPLDIKYQSKKNINMVPLINIVFLLLVFFMLAGSIKNEEKIEYEPPESNTSQSLNKIEPYILISSNNKYFYFDEEVSIDTLKIELAKIAKNNVNKIFIKSDKNALSKNLIKIISLARQSGIEKAAIVTVNNE